MSRPDPTRPPTDIRLKLAAALFDNLTPALIMSATFVVVGFVAIFPLEDPALDAALVLGSIAGLVRVVLLLVFRRRVGGAMLSEGRIVGWERAYAAALYLFGACLGLFCTLAVLSGTATTRMFVVALLFAWGSGIVSRVAGRPWIAVPGLLIAVVPPIVAFTWVGELENTTIAGMLTLFTLGSFETVRYIHRALVAQMSLAHELADQARRDPLTGVGNRLLHDEVLRDALANRNQNGGFVAVHHVDLDGFKTINDALGHPAGDTVLKAVAARLAGIVRDGDVTTRLGGDEFVVIQRSCGNRGEAELLARRIVRALGAPIAIEGRNLRVGASVGVALAPGDGATPDVIRAKADAALYRAKTRGRNRFVMSGSEPDVRALAS